MHPALTELLGYAAALLTTAAFVPQALKSWRKRDLSGISLTMYSLFTLGVALWLLYGIALGSWPIILANTITLVLAGVVLALKLAHLKENADTSHIELADASDHGIRPLRSTSQPVAPSGT